MSAPKEYTVGWICAISTEYTAAKAFLDETHLTPEPLSPADNNAYTVGMIGKHKVVIAVLPDGEYGTTSAASVARDMLHSFPNIKIGLMVGIGGGAPSSKHDIRLGDIVVSASRDGRGGVFQYDFGKAIQQQSFQQTGVLNQPPTSLRTALSALKSDYESDGHRLEESINSILDQKPRLRKKYRRPEASSDKLYRSEFVHPVDEASCAVTCGDARSHLVSRQERTDDEDNPAIHYGLIASSNQLMKDALIRDRLVIEKDVLCFEMEAAGLMNHFPCLVIRGICDYADSHKNKEWQGYAAMVAAAYAKDLLQRISLNRIDAEEKISVILSGLSR
jgi:nucleoside phosphorylase